jgi:hypothetical protein
MAAAPNPRRIRALDLHTDCEYVFFVSSSGHCSLDCTYCIVNPVVKHQPTLDYEDFAFLLGQVRGGAFLILSGKGDFFAGYKKHERLLERLLAHDVEIALDINGVMIHEFPDLDEGRLRKIRAVNLTMHYTQLLARKALAAWARNARTLIERLGGERFLSGFILSPAERTFWREGIEFYEREVFALTGQPLVLIKDVNRPFTASQEAEAGALAQRYGHVIEEVHQEDFAQRFARFEQVSCPAGSRYFRVWNDGRVEGCPYVGALADCGNLKARVFKPRSGPFRCGQARYCDCNNIALAGKMVFPDSSGRQVT